MRGEVDEYVPCVNAVVLYDGDALAHVLAPAVDSAMVALVEDDKLVVDGAMVVEPVGSTPVDEEESVAPN